MKRFLAGMLAVLLLCGGVPALAAAPAAAKLPDGFALGADKVKELLVYRYSDQVSVWADAAQVLPLLAAVKPTAQADGKLGKELAEIPTLTVLLTDDSKYTINLYEKGVTVAKALPGKDTGTAVSYTTDAAAYTALCDHLRTRMTEGKWRSSWLSTMRSSKAQQAAINLSPGDVFALYDAGEENFERVFCALNSFRVEPGSMEKVKENALLLETELYIELTFQNHINYDILISKMKEGKRTVQLRSSDMDYALRYQSTQSITLFEHLARGERIAPNTGKPVIYLYPQQKKDVSVKVHFKGELAQTEPAYNGGWNVTAYPDGAIVNKADGKTYPYLFWDGYSQEDWDFSRGFVVKGSEAQAFLAEKLAYLGLNPQESHDFMEYWLPELRQNAYNLLTFSTEQYQALAPLTISPAPESVLRVHMVFKGIDAPVEIQPQTLTRFVRSGFTVVEWGGTRA